MDDDLLSEESVEEGGLSLKGLLGWAKLERFYCLHKGAILAATYTSIWYLVLGI